MAASPRILVLACDARRRGLIELDERLEAETQAQRVLEAAVAGLALILDADGASIWPSSPAGVWEGHLAAPIGANPRRARHPVRRAPVAGEALVHLPGNTREPALAWAASGPDYVLVAVRRADEGWPPDDAR